MNIAPEFRIRHLTAADFPAADALWKVEPRMTMPREQFETILARNPTTCLCGEVNGRISAICIGHWDGRRGILNSVVVNRQYRGRGFGKQLVEATLAALRAVGCRRFRLFVYKYNEEVVPFYEGIGFHVKTDVHYMAMDE